VRSAAIVVVEPRREVDELAVNWTTWLVPGFETISAIPYGPQSITKVSK
jgi:hypothetical protein